MLSNTEAELKKYVTSKNSMYLRNHSSSKKRTTSNLPFANCNQEYKIFAINGASFCS